MHANQLVSKSQCTKIADPAKGKLLILGSDTDNLGVAQPY